ncbi:ABC transporter ATP-binding protein [Bengtsoniella intestinalis]|uniref:ABC transporter ATP-binding protein n=1 Tax=Bengtsoniella intestinalis TaxID=3073143 RepID=UPI00391F3544
MLKQLWPYTKGYRQWIAVGVICSAAEAVFELLIPLVMADIVDIGIANGDVNYIAVKGLTMVAMAIISLCFGVGAAFFSSRAGFGLGANLRDAQFAHIQDFAFENIERFSTASLITRMTSDVNAIQVTLMMGIRLMVRAPVMLVTALVLAIFISVQLSLSFAVAIPVLVVFIGMMLVRVGPLFKKLQACIDGLNLAVQEDVTNIRVVKSFAQEDYQNAQFDEKNQDLKKASQTAFGTVITIMPTMMLVIYATIIAVLWFGGQMVFAGDLEVGKLTSMFTYVTQILMALMMVSMVSMQATRAIACAKRVCEVLSETPAISDNGNQDLLVEHGTITFENVSFKYHKDAPNWILENINLTIPAGATVGVLGATGSAKTTLVSLIPRLYEADSGVVSVGGRPVRDYTLHNLRNSVAMVLQQNTLFSGTILENLRWGNPEATEEQVLKACESACVDEFLDRMEDGLNTDLGQGGVNVSGGQKQRLCIARAILKQPKILILDDSTSAVDTATDAKIRKAFAEDLGDTTKIIIAQRISSVMDADLILVMDDGRISAQGIHGDLMERSEIYRSIYDAQQKGVDDNG